MIDAQKHPGGRKLPGTPAQNRQWRDATKKCGSGRNRLMHRPLGAAQRAYCVQDDNDDLVDRFAGFRNTARETLSPMTASDMDLAKTRASRVHFSHHYNF
jgi:hypothetical protein